MKKFEDLTISGKENSIKIGKTVPEDGVGLAWFSGVEVTPENHIYTIDMSDTIPENRLSNIQSTKIMYADELGFLRDIETNNPIIPTNDITIANTYISKNVGQSYISNVNEIDKNDFVHYYYVSRYFTAATTDYGLISLDDFQSKTLNSIKVFDSSGNDYVDSVTRKKKYRILLEPYATQANSGKYEIPHRIIILLDASEPTNLTLLYDRVNVDENGLIINQQIRYSENINAVPFFEEVPEEAYVLDPNYKNRKIFSVKKKIAKNSDLTTNTITNSGYQVAVPGKAVSDNRTFETFNWRFVVKNLRQFDAGQYNYGIDPVNINNSSTRNVKAAVLYSSLNGLEADKNPFVFYQLQNSPFNLSRFNYINPLATNAAITKNNKDYWLVDIDTQSLTSSTGENNFDILVWKVASPITPDQSVKIIAYLNNSGTILLDLSGVTSNSAASAIDARLSKSSNMSAANNMTLNTSNSILSANLCGGFSISSSTFNESNYNILGDSRVHNTDIIKEFHVFDNTTIEAASKVLSIGTSTSTLNPVALLLKYAGTSTIPAQGNLIATTFEVLDYCNDTYDSSGSSVRNEITIPAATGQQSYVDYLEGPFKFLYNCVAYSLYSRAQATFVRDNRSPLYTYVSPWNFSWTMNTSALLQEEKNKDFLPITATSKYGKKVLQSTDVTVFDAYKNSLRQNLPQDMHSSLINIVPNSVEIYIECTNPDVSFDNTTIATAESADIASSYTLHRVNDKNKIILAYTDAPSPLFSQTTNMGAHMIIEKDIQLTNSGNPSSIPLTSISSLKKYNFDLYSRYYYNTNSETGILSNILTKLTFNATLNIAGSKTIQTLIPSIRENVSINCINSKSAIDTFGFLRAGVSSAPENNFIYTGDIDLGNSSRWWKVGTNGDYVRYIQYSMVADNITVSGKSIAVDGQYGAQTEKAVKAFQQKHNLRYKDGTVDSETKSYIATQVWKVKSEEDFQNFVTYANSTGNSNITKYMLAARNAGIVSDINEKEYQKISFSGFRGPGEVFDILFVELPENTLNTITSINIEFGSWNNVEINGYGYGPNYDSDIKNYPVNNVYVSYKPVDNIIQLPIPNVDYANARYMWFAIKGGALESKYGYAEGFSISKIYCLGTTTLNVESDQNIPVNAQVEIMCTLNDVYQRISPASPVTKSYSNFSLIPNKNSILVTKIQNLNYAESDNIYLSTLLDSPNSTPQLVSIIDAGTTVQSCVISSFNINSVEIVSSSNGPTTYFQYARNQNSVTISTDVTQYSNSIILSTDNSLSSANYINDANTNISLGSVPGVTVFDGVIRLAKSDGTPYGIPSTTDIANGTGISNVDISYGLIYISNRSVENEGLMYGFYDNREKLFLGRALTYNDIIQRGIDNVYIAVAATDADGNLAQSRSREYIGINAGSTFVPAKIPLKLRAPIYSVNLKPRSAISIGKFNESIDRFSAWPLPIKPGSFNRKFILPSLGEKNVYEWMRNYIGKELVVNYSTLDLSNQYWSQIFGHGYYDVVDETPTIVSTRSIKVKITPIVSAKEYTNYKYTIANLTKPQVIVYTRDSVNSAWQQVQRSAIRNINCSTGLIEFTRDIISTNESLTKVSYVVKNKDVQLLHINGQEVPLNPILNYDKIKFNKPLYIYLMPESIYKKNSDTGIVSYKRVTEYTHNSSINFSYDNLIFAEKSDIYNPFALLLAVIYVTDNPSNNIPQINDIRTRGGGIEDGINYDTLVTNISNVSSYWDIYPPQGQAYNKGGYIIVQIPENVKNNFIDKQEVYEIIRSNLTAGIVFDVENESGNSW